MIHDSFDDFHPPRDDDPYWTETNWWSFFVPERRLSCQLYPFFRPNQNVASCAVFIWNDEGCHLNTALYARQCWHLPMTGEPLTDFTLPNGLHYKCLERNSHYHMQYSDPAGEDVHIDVEFRAIAPPHYDGHGHLDQPGRITGTMRLDGEDIAIDCLGFHDRSWGRRLEFGQKNIKAGGHQLGYSYASVSADHAFHALTYDKGHGIAEINHGYYIRDGRFAKLRKGQRDVLERDPATGYPTRIQIIGIDESGREFQADGRCVNAFALLLNPNIWTVNCLVEWTFDDVTVFGEDHDNWTPYGYRRFYRNFLSYRHAPAFD